MNDQNHWASLKRVDGNDVDSEPIRLFADRYSIGRGEDCDIKFPNNMLLSGNHCRIERDENKKAWLVDTSTNGTCLNLKDRVSKEKKELIDNDFIYLVYRKNEPEKNIIFQFETTAKPALNFEATQAYNLFEFNNLASDEEDDDQRQTQEEEPEKKKIKVEEKKNDDNDDELADVVTCSICNEIMHDCVSLQPCLHTYCGGCYSEWMPKSNECPLCKKQVERISKSHIVNNIIESYLKAHPDKKRPEKELKELDEKNVIKQDMIYPKDFKVAKFKDDYDENNNEKEEVEEREPSDRGSIFNSDNSDDDDPDPDYGANMQNNFNFNPNPFMGIPFAQPVNYFNNYQFQPNLNQPFQYVCRQCPQRKALLAYNGPDDYTCTPVQNHLLCQCCLEAFPDRADRPKPHNCSVCFKPYCNLYWGCNKPTCKKCLTKFGNLNLDVDFEESLINENPHESKLFSEWIHANGLTLQQVFADCMRRAQDGEFKLNLVDVNSLHDRVVCRGCGFKLFRELAYQYRIDLENNEFIEKDKHRPNCFYGKNCRTQKHNMDHAKKFNHICEQTKF